MQSQHYCGRHDAACGAVAAVRVEFVRVLFCADAGSVHVTGVNAGQNEQSLIY